MIIDNALRQWLAYLTPSHIHIFSTSVIFEALIVPTIAFIPPKSPAIPSSLVETTSTVLTTLFSLPWIVPFEELRPTQLRVVTNFC